METSLDAVKYLINNILKPNFDISAWQVWREKYLWIIEVDDILKSNIVALKALH